jgi:hypothetical protein
MLGGCGLAVLDRLGSVWSDEVRKAGVGYGMAGKICLNNKKILPVKVRLGSGLGGASCPALSFLKVD